MKSHLRVGTRASDLAQSQTLEVVKLIKKKFPKLRVHLKTFTTEGDRNLSQPLWQTDGKDFWVKELDSALLNGEVDLVVHSLKDLSLTRPTGIVCGAVPLRADPRDLLLLRRKKRTQNKPWKIGTSSPRRIELLKLFWKKHFEHTHGTCEIVFLRGNVITRLGRLRPTSTSGEPLDGICLAVAGVQRLLLGAPRFKTKVASLLKNLEGFVLPLSEFPGAPGQGALAVECRDQDLDTRTLLKAIHSPELQSEVAWERKVLADAGGGCHSPIGATVVDGVLHARQPGSAIVDFLNATPPSLRGPDLSRSLFVGAFTPPQKSGPLVSRISSWDPLDFRQSLGWEFDWARFPRPLILVVSSPLTAAILTLSLSDTLRSEIRSGSVTLSCVGQRTWDALASQDFAAHIAGLHAGRESLWESLEALKPLYPRKTIVFATGSGEEGTQKYPRGAKVLNVYHRSPSQAPRSLHPKDYEHFIFSSYSCFQAFKSAFKEQMPHLLKYLDGRTWSRKGRSFSKIRDEVPSVQPWLESFWTLESRS